MIENEELGLKIAESPREKLIQDTIENVEKSILGLELELKLKREGLKYLKSLS